jgi:hypothetical protein
MSYATVLGVLSLQRALVHLLYASKLSTDRASARGPLVVPHAHLVHQDEEGWGIVTPRACTVLR